MNYDSTEIELEEAMKEGAENDFKHAFKSPKNKKEVYYKIATYLIEKHNIKTIGGVKVREIFIYKDGIYIEGVNMLHQEIRELLEELCKKHDVNEIIETIKDRTVADRKDFFVDLNFINLNNGVLNIRTNELFPHNPKYLFFSKFPLNYKNGVDCPNIKNFLKETLKSEDITIFQEWLGFGLYRRYFIKKAMIFVGEKDTGKSTSIRVIQEFYGLENICSMSLQKISHDKFATSNFYNKHMNTYDELDYNDIQNNGHFKMVTGGVSIPGEYKFGNQFLFINYAKLLFACNKIPDVKDANDEAYFDRWIVIPFNNMVDKDKIDPFLIEKLTTLEEMSGLLNFALEGLQRLLKNNRFSYEKTPDEIKVEMLRSGSTVANFAYDCLEQDPKSWISKEDMYKAFVEYAVKNKLPSGISIKTIGSKLPKYVSYISEGKPKDKDGKQITAWMGVKFKEQEVDL